MVNIVNPSVEIYSLDSVDDIKKHIEKCGRTCYKSENLITDTSAINFINGILKSGHESVIEHANLIFSAEKRFFNKLAMFTIASKVKGMNVSSTDNYYIISMNMRTLRDVARLGINDFNTLLEEYNLSTFVLPVENTNTYLNNLSLEGVQEMTTSTGALEEHTYITIHAVCDVGVYKDITRHRPCSFSIESTRYCNYSKDKFNNSLNFIKPVHIKENTEEYNIWYDCMSKIEESYMAMSKIPNIRVDQLRMMLPHSTKADVVMTTNITEWKHIFGLRCATAAHPAVRQWALNTLDLFYKKYPKNFEQLYKQYEKDINEFRY